MTRDRQSPGPHDDESEKRLWDALAAKPGVAVPTGFAQRVVAAARAEGLQPESRAVQPESRAVRFFGWAGSWAGVAALCSMALLVGLMFCFAEVGQGSAPLVAEMTLSLEFVLLLLGMVYFRRGLE